MKYPELSCYVYAEVDGENVLLIEIDKEGRAKVYHENLRNLSCIFAAPGDNGAPGGGY